MLLSQPSEGLFLSSSPPQLVIVTVDTNDESENTQATVSVRVVGVAYLRGDFCSFSIQFDNFHPFPALPPPFPPFGTLSVVPDPTIHSSLPFPFFLCPEAFPP